MRLRLIRRRKATEVPIPQVEINEDAQDRRKKHQIDTRARA